MKPASPSPLLAVDDLTFAYPGQPPLLSNWSASIPAGITQLHGGDGSGKSTVLRLLAGRQASGGRFTLAGQLVDAGSAAYQRNVFFVDPAHQAFDQVTALECTSALQAGDEHFDEARWQRLADGFSLAPHLAKPMFMLSTGSKRKVWLAAALASGRTLTLIDEPTAALDNASIRFFWHALAELAHARERAIVIASAERIDPALLSGTIELAERAS